MANGEVLDLFASLHSLHQAYWRSCRDPVASRAVFRLRIALGDVVSLGIASVLEEMRSHPADPQVQTTGIQLLRAVIADSNGTAKGLLQRGGGVEALVQSMRQHCAAETLLEEALIVLDELHGIPALLQALEHLRHSAPAVRVALTALSRSLRANWAEAEKLPAESLVRGILQALQQHPSDQQLIAAGLQVLGDLAGDLAPVRGAFAASGGWEWLLSMLEAAVECPELQLQGVRLLAQLCRGGSWTEAYAPRAAAVLEQAVRCHSADDKLLYWGLWGVQQIHGAEALASSLKVVSRASVASSTLRALAGLSWGQGDGAGPQHAMTVVDGVLNAMRAYQGDANLLEEGVIVLGRVAGFAAEREASTGTTAPSFRAGSMSIGALLEVLPAYRSNAQLVNTTLQALAEALDGCHSPTSQLHLQICDGLFGRGSGACNGNVRAVGAGLLFEVAEVHATNATIQTTSMWLACVARGPAAVVTEMEYQPLCHPVQLCGIKSLASFYGDHLELEAAASVIRPAAIRVISAAMQSFPENLVLQQNGCYGLSTIAEHGLDSTVDESHMVVCLQAATKALALVQGQSDNDNMPWSYNALYLRQEGARLVASVCSNAPGLGPRLREGGGEAETILSDALVSTVTGIADGIRDSTAEEAVQLELTALAYIVGPTVAVLHTLRRWGASKPSVSRAAADTVVDLVRRGQTSPKDLQESGILAELLTTLQAHQTDDDLRGRLQLALGFAGGAAVS